MGWMAVSHGQARSGAVVREDVEGRGGEGRARRLGASPDAARRVWTSLDAGGQARPLSPDVGGCARHVPDARGHGPRRTQASMWPRRMWAGAQGWASMWRLAGHGGGEGCAVAGLSRSAWGGSSAARRVHGGAERRASQQKRRGDGQKLE
jgi:hypothetical protein